MKRVTLKSMARVFVLGMLVLLFACSNEPNEIGVWEHTTDEGSLEFKADGRVIMVDNMKSTVAGTYRLTDSGELSLNLTMSNIMKEELEQMDPFEIKAQMQVNGDTLEFIIDGQTDVFTRVK